MNKQIEIVKDLMSKYNLTNKDLFSFCICAVNFLEYYYEESMYDMMRSCPERYAGADSNNRKAVAGALTGEKKDEKWTDVDQFAHYMESIQEAIASEFDDDGKLTYHFLGEMERFETVYRREVMIPFMLGCPVEDYDDGQFYDEEYIASIVNVEGMTLYKANEEQRNIELKAFQEAQAAGIASEVEKKKNDENFSVLLVSPLDIAWLKNKYNEYNKTFYPDRDYQVITRNPNAMIIQTGGKSIEEVKERILKTVRQSIVLLGHKTKEDLIPVEKAFGAVPVPNELKNYNVTHVVTYI